MVLQKIHGRIDPIMLSIILYILGIVGLIIGLYLPLVVLPASYSGPTDWPQFHALSYTYSPAEVRYLLFIGILIILSQSSGNSTPIPPMKMVT